MKPPRPAYATGDVVLVDVDALDDEGRGRGIDAATGWDLAVRGALPGERVSARVERTFPARTLAQAVLIGGASPATTGTAGSPATTGTAIGGPATTTTDAAITGTDATTGAPFRGLRVARDCPHEAPCPGCPLEGVDRGFVMALKRERVVQALVEHGLPDLVPLVDDVEAARAPRQKAKLTAGGAAGALAFGLFVPWSHDLRAATSCPHQDPDVSHAILVVQRALDTLAIPPATTSPTGVKAVIARSFVEGVGVVVVVGAPLSGEQWRALVEATSIGAPPASLESASVEIASLEPASVEMASLEPAEVAPARARIVSLAVRVDGAGTNSIVSGDVQRFVGPQLLTPLEGGAPAGVDAFCQTDPALALEMYTRAAGFLVDGGLGRPPPHHEGRPPPHHEGRPPPQVDGRRKYADLYAGAGGFARAILAAAAPDTASVVAVERAAASVEALSSLSGVDVIASSVEDALSALASHKLDGIVVDPPKSGLKEAGAAVAALGAPRVVLVACDPDSGAKDARVFVAAGYRVLRIEPLDLFPATPEVETLFFLQQQ